MAKKQTNPKHPRDSIGLTAAANGDVHGVNVFVRFVERELSMMSDAFDDQLPEPVAQLCKRLTIEMDRAGHYLDGYIAASKEPGDV